MAVAHGVTTLDTASWATATARTLTFTPTGTPRGIIVRIVQTGASTDQVSGVTYGGVAMKRWAFYQNTGTEPGAVYIYFLGVGIPAGAQSCIVTSTGTSPKILTCANVTAAADTSIDAVAGVAYTGTNPSLEIITTVLGILYYVQQSHADAPVTTPQASTTHEGGFGFGTQSAHFARKPRTITGYGTVGYTNATAAGVHATIMVREGAPAAVARAADHAAGGLTEWDRQSTYASDPAAAVVASTTQAYNDTNSSKATVGAVGLTYARTQWDTNHQEGMEFWFGGGFYLPVGLLTPLASELDLIRMDNFYQANTGTDQYGVAIHDTDNKVKVIQNTLGATPQQVVLITGPVMTEGTWYWIEVRTKIHSVTGSAINELWVNGSLVGSSTTRNARRSDIIYGALKYGIVAQGPTVPAGFSVWYDRARIALGQVGPLVLAGLPSPHRIPRGRSSPISRSRAASHERLDQRPAVKGARRGRSRLPAFTRRFEPGLGLSRQRHRAQPRDGGHRGRYGRARAGRGLRARCHRWRVCRGGARRFPGRRAGSSTLHRPRTC